MTVASLHSSAIPVHDAESHAARIGPNALIQTAAVLCARFGDAEAGDVLMAATGRTIERLPSDMVHEGEVNSLMAELRKRYGHELAASILHESGERTAAYLLANRIPAAAQWVIRMLPRMLGTRLLLSAVGRHAWTFAGSGRFSYIVGSPTTLCFGDCAICRGRSDAAPVCDYYAATFETLFRKLVNSHTRVREVECCAAGGSVCRFVIGRA